MKMLTVSNNYSRCSRGFSLIELLVVLVILGLLAGLVGPRVMKYLGGAKSDSAKLQVEDMSAALDLFRLEVGGYPSTEQGLEALVADPGNLAGWNGPYLKKNVIPQDPWGNDYHYKFPGDHGEFDIYSNGADGQPGGEGESADIVSWN